jgi:SAM-dependent methyltransferase
MTSPASTSDATTEAMELLREDSRSQCQEKTGYVDVLGELERVGPHANQRVFRSKLVPPIYERIWRPLVARIFCGRKLKVAQERRLVLEALSISPGDRVLDVGCGPGTYTRPLAEAAGNGLVVGIDASEAMVAAAARRGERQNLAYVRGDGGGLPFGDGHFDAVCCVGVIHLLEDPMTALSEMVRVLAPGGRIMLGASCGKRAEARVRGGLTVFGRDQLPAEMSARGLADVDQRVFRRAQIVSGRKPTL